ncbi:hypothetical protein FGE12_06325 [Aggregicoccus sp. 17bor-14]|uniref:hypothetical protein n=1 Tax=Myxococcaceae TaxID=31 RepID=UPI00129C19FC|nr:MULTISPECIES: hypothetical protein [Myxococcaceae]MBF5042003.1 hypothetical protein [Simulacricoccus sp. 17bor-14]MRI87783.1 hypothetical protein [Aggregicoccus sp. 17bor-14]
MKSACAVLLAATLLAAGCGGEPSKPVRSTIVLEGGISGEYEARSSTDDISLTVDTVEGLKVVANVTVWFEGEPRVGTFHCRDLSNAVWGAVDGDEGSWQSGCQHLNPGDLTLEVLSVERDGDGYVLHGSAVGVAAPFQSLVTGPLTVNAVF